MKTYKIKDIIYSILFIVLSFGIIQLISLLGHLSLGETKLYVYSITVSILVIVMTWFFLRIQRKTFKDIGLIWKTTTLKNFFIGFLIGNGICILMIAILLSFTELSISEVKDSSFLVVLLGALVFIPMAFLEEIIFRGYPFIKLSKAIGIRITMLVMAILFAFYHDFSGKTFLSQLLGPGIWAFVFGLAVLRTGGIALATGLHFATNFSQAFVGMKSGHASLWQIQYTNEVTKEIQSQTESIGLILQITLLIVTILFIELHIYKKRKLINN